MFRYIADYLSYDVHLSESVNFFVYDMLKISFLVFVVVSVIAFFRTYVRPEKIREMMAHLKFGLGNLVAAMFGAVTPFCSCSSIPLFIGFIKANIPLSIAFSFLVTSPLVNEVAFVIMGGLFGWKVAVAYAVSGIALGVVSGLVIGAFKMDSELLLEKRGFAICVSQKKMPDKFEAKVKYAISDGWNTFKSIFPYLFVGVLIGAAIHGYVPQEFFMNYVGKYELLSVPIAVLIGIPIYAGCSTIAPTIFIITAGGVPLGTSLAFMMAIAGLSLPEAIMLKKVMSMKLLVLFFGVVAVGITIIGYLFNFLFSN